MEHYKAGGEKGAPTNFKVDKIGEDNEMEGADDKVREKEEGLWREKMMMLKEKKTFSYSVNLLDQISEHHLMPDSLCDQWKASL